MAAPPGPVVYRTVDTQLITRCNLRAKGAIVPCRGPIRSRVRAGPVFKTNSARHLSDLIGAIYDCALEPQRWQATLETIRLAINCANASLLLQAMPSGEVLLSVSAAIAPEVRTRMDSSGSEIIEVWGGQQVVMAQDVNKPHVLSWLRPQRFWEDHPYFIEVWKPQGIIDLIAIVTARDASAVGSIGFGRHASAGPFTEDDVHLLELLIPHLQRATAISRVLEIATVRADTFRAAMDTMGTGVIIVDAQLRILHGNAAARSILAEADGITNVQGRLTPASPSAREALRSSVRPANASQAGPVREAMGIAAHRSGGPAVLHVLPITRDNLRLGLTSDAVAAVFISPTTMPRSASADVLATLYDLTPVEAKICALLMSRQTIAQTAASLGVAHGTVKTHLLRIFAKTGTHRQADLVSLGASLSLMA